MNVQGTQQQQEQEKEEDEFGDSCSLQAMFSGSREEIV